ncbi:MAG: short-chain dehydrogenase [Tenericutes bacterium]|nr:MAG: short-chain dehydrogenase [Mycoplasmatota bacterium]
MLENVILVTGAGRRIGLHLTQRLHQDGYSVIAHYRTLTPEIQVLASQGITIMQAEFDNKDSILQFLSELKACCASFRGIIHNASAFEPTSSILEQAATQYERFFNIHMMAPYLLNQGLRPLMQGTQQKPADIIHITDINAENPTDEFDIYGSTKAGLHNLTLALAKRFAPEIKVNAVAPGPVLFSTAHSDMVKQAITAETPLGREGGAEAVYLAVKSLLDNAFITGISIPVDGGRRLSKR